MKNLNQTKFRSTVVVVSTIAIECYFWIDWVISAIMIPKTDYCDIKILSGLQIRVCNPTKNKFSYFSAKTNVMDPQENPLIETVLLSTQLQMLKLTDEKILTISG